MLKKTLFPILYAAFFLVSSAFFWYYLSELFLTPFLWMNPGFELQLKLIPIGISIIGAIIAASLITIFKPHLLFSRITFVLGALVSLFFLPVTELTFISACIFAIGFLMYEHSTYHTFHSFIKIKFWETYSHTIPGLLTTLAFCVAIGSFQASSLAVQEFRISIPDALMEQTLRMFQPSVPAQTPDPAMEELLQQLEGLVPQQTMEDANARILEQTKLQIEAQINRAVEQYRPFIPFISAAALFFFFSILNFPVMILSIAVVSLIMKILTRTGVISILTVKMDVERFAW